MHGTPTDGSLVLLELASSDGSHSSAQVQGRASIGAAAAYVAIYQMKRASRHIDGALVEIREIGLCHKHDATMHAKRSAGELCCCLTTHAAVNTQRSTSVVCRCAIRARLTPKKGKPGEFDIASFDGDRHARSQGEA